MKYQLPASRRTKHLEMRASAEDAGGGVKGGERVIRWWTRLMDKMCKRTEPLMMAAIATIAAIAAPLLWVGIIASALYVIGNLIELFNPLFNVIVQYL